jgi:(p)ppGpp synthase/HD superfamily hydrolase
MGFTIELGSAEQLQRVLDRVGEVEGVTQVRRG